jgi:hypothetical protein
MTFLNPFGRKILLLSLLLAAPAFPSQAPGDGTIFGRVVDQSTGEPLRKVIVALRPTDIRAVTGDNGEYRLEGIAAGSYVLQVSTIGYRLLKKDIQLEDDESKEILFYLPQESATIRETVIVTTPIFAEVEKEAPSQLTLNNTEIRNLAGVLLDDPLRSVQTLPGVVTGDDFNAGYSIRGGSFDNNGIVIDGALTHNLTHTVSGLREPTGSITAINGDMAQSIALYAEAFSAKYGDRTASFLDVITREGSRDRNRARMAVSGSNAAFVVEGPLAAKRGAWIASFRKSYADYLVRALGPTSDIVMGFTDAQAKIVYDLNSLNQLAAALIWGNSDVSRSAENRGVTSLVKATNNVGIANFSWTWTPGPKLFSVSRVYLMREAFDNTNKNNLALQSGTYAEGAVKSDISFLLPAGHRIEFGFLSRHIINTILDRRYNYTLQKFADFGWPHGRYWQHAGYVQDRWKINHGHLNFIFGARFDATGLTGQAVAHPRASLEWNWGKKNKIDAGWGIYSQFPETLQVLGQNGNSSLRAEIARHYLFGYERMLGDTSRIRVELFEKQNSDLERSRESMYRIVKGKVTVPDINYRNDNGLSGFCRGFEIFLQRRSANRIAGWISYSYAISKQHDLVTGEKYNSDYDQRHTINLYGSYRFSESWNLSAKIRLGSGFPYPGYFEQRGSDFYLATARNEVRLPAYSRIDLRLSKAFYYKRSSKLSLFLEALNVMNRENTRYDLISSVNATTRLVSMQSNTLLPILPTAGFIYEF